MEATGKLCESAAKYGIKPSTALNLWTKYKNTGTTKNLPCSGHPPKLSDHGWQLVVQNCVNEHREPFQKIAHDTMMNISEHTVRWRGAEWMMHERENTNACLMIVDDENSNSTCVYVPPKPLTNMCKHSSCRSGMLILNIPSWCGCRCRIPSVDCEEGPISLCTPEEEEDCMGQWIQGFWCSRMAEFDMVRWMLHSPWWQEWPGLCHTLG